VAAGAGAGREALLVAALAAGPLAAAWLGAPGPFRLGLNLGPWDGPYISGFARDHEVNDKTGTHWTTYDAAITLPLQVRGGSLMLSYRYARVLPQTAVVKVLFDGKPVDEFSCRGGRFEERQVAVTAPEPVPVSVQFKVDSHDRKNLGLNMDWLRLESASAGLRRLSGGARLRPALLVALFALLLRRGGWSRSWAAALTSPLALAAIYGLWRDPWLVHRLLTGVPESLAVFGLVGLALGRDRLPAADLRALTALGLVAFVLRAVAVNHPDFYYPDLMTHARLVDAVRGAGLDFFRAPAQYVNAQGAWTKPAYGGSSGLPYAVGFHLLFVPWDLSYDALLTAEKLAGVVLSTIPIFCLWVVAQRLGASTLGAALMVLIPTYTSRLSFALLPALTGHAWDMVFIAWLAYYAQELGQPRVFAVGAALLAACQLAYVSSITNLSLFLGALALLAAWEAAGARVATAGRLLALGLAGSALAVALYYRDFLGAAQGLVPRIFGPAEARASQYPVESWWLLSYTRTRDFFDGVYPLLTLAGLALLWRRGRGRALLAAWLAAYFLLLFLRAKIPDVFRYGHETLFVTPLVCLASAEALAWLWSLGKGGRAAAVAGWAFLTWQGLTWQWRAIADQLANAL